MTMLLEYNLPVILCTDTASLQTVRAYVNFFGMAEGTVGRIFDYSKTEA